MVKNEGNAQNEQHYTVHNGTGHPLSFDQVTIQPDPVEGRVLRAIRIDTHLGNLSISNYNIPIYEVHLGALENPETLEEWAAELRANRENKLAGDVLTRSSGDVIGVSRFAERAWAQTMAHDLGVRPAHPAFIRRKGRRRRLIGAGGLAIAAPGAPTGARHPERIQTLRNHALESITTISNASPDKSLLIETNEGSLFKPKDNKRSAEPVYNHEIIGESTEGVPITQSRPLHVENIPEHNPTTLHIIHSEAWIELYRLYAHNEKMRRQLSQMAILYRPKRLPDGQQGTVGRGLAFLDNDTLDTIVELGI